jgi:hypothetical protein
MRKSGDTLHAPYIFWAREDFLIWGQDLLFDDLVNSVLLVSHLLSCLHFLPFETLSNFLSYLSLS